MFAQGSELQRLALNQGRVNLRSLATTDSTEKVTLDKYSENLGVFVNLGEEYLKNNSLTLKNQTDMTVLLYTNVTAFCSNCNEFLSYNCTGNSCNADTTVKQTFISPCYQFREANPINHTVSIGNTSNPSWKLANNASLFESIYKSTNYYYSSSGSNSNYFNNRSIYGFVGLGVGGGAASNFKGDHPLFSVSINSTGYGSLIFGKDSTLYDSSKTPVTLTTDTNWTMMTKNLTFGNYSNSALTSNLIFDLQHSGISIPKKSWDDDEGFFKNLQKNYNLSSYYYTEDSCYTFYGNLTTLPDLVIGLENGKSLTIPPAAYTRKSTRTNNTYLILIGYTPSVTNNSDPENKKADYTILGLSFLSQFYTIFEQKTGSEPTITLYPAKASSGSSDNSSNSTPTSLGTRAIQLAVVVVLLAVLYTCFKNRAAAKLQNELGEQLNRKASAF